MLSGKPAWRKQEATWRVQEEWAAQQEVESLKVGRGVEHHLPHLYSQVGVGEMVVVEVQRDAVLVVDVEVVGGVVGWDVVDEVGGYVGFVVEVLEVTELLVVLVVDELLVVLTVVEVLVELVDVVVLVTTEELDEDPP
jgi:hypothetical protein